MNVDVFELIPDDGPTKDCYDCLGCSHLVAISMDNTHNVRIECNFDNADIELK